MLAEQNVELSSRYLMLHTRLSPKRFAREKSAALHWCSKNPARLSESNLAALAKLQDLELEGNFAAFIQLYAYADIPPGRTYSTLFELGNPQNAAEARARLELAIFWRQIPLEVLEHGHHHLVVFEFPDGVPSLLSLLPVDHLDGTISEQVLGMCDHEAWQAHCEHERSSRSTAGGSAAAFQGDLQT